MRTSSEGMYQDGGWLVSRTRTARNESASVMPRSTTRTWRVEGFHARRSGVVPHGLGRGDGQLLGLVLHVAHGNAPSIREDDGTAGQPAATGPRRGPDAADTGRRP